MRIPTADAFAALARSSPWRWRTLRFTVGWTGPHPTWPEPVRAWLRRPDDLRVETLAGALVQVVREQRPTIGVLTSDGGRTEHLPWAAEAGAPAPEFRPDGLVARRPGRFDLADDPMFQNYHWVAMLDPVELADGVDPDTGEVVPGPAAERVAVVDHGGREAWEAVVRAVPGYEPRCGCCSLLRTPAVDAAEWGGPRLDEYPGAYRVRLDAGTGVCVLTEAIGGSPVAGHELRIEAVDEPMDDDLFAAPRRGRFRRGRFRRGPGWSPSR